MGTRSRIGILNTDGTVEAVYCHFDGSPSHNGKILLEHYTDENKIREFLSYGDLSALRPNIGQKHAGREDYDSASEQGWCVFYARDRGEDINETHSKIFQSVAELIGVNEEYTYVFNPVTKQWFWTTWENKGLKPMGRLHPEDCERD